MNARRYGPAVCSSRGILYAFGGDVYGPAPRRSVERLDPSVGRWEIMAKMARCHTGVVPVAFDDHIYVCGGGLWDYDDSVERHSITKNQWEELPKMPAPRNDCTAMVWQGRVLLVAGLNGGDGGDTDLEIPL